MDRTTSSSMASSALHSVLTTAMCAMQREIKQFLICCLHPEDTTTSSTSNTNSGNNKSNNNRQTGRSGNVLNMEGVSSYEQGMFSLGIITEDDHPTIRGRTGQFYKLGPGQSNASSLFFPTASRTSVLSMSMEDFVKKVLFPRTNASANYHNALFFRQSVANFTRECDELSKELIHMTTPPEERKKRTKIMDDSSPPTAVDFLDNIIHTKLLPVMQNDATMALVSALEKTDAFDPPIGVLYNNRKAVRGAMGVDVGMCLACQTLFDSTGPLFFAMQRVPHGGEMYTPLVAVLEHALLTFNSRVSKRVEFVCRNKTATATAAASRLRDGGRRIDGDAGSTGCLIACGIGASKSDRCSAAGTEGIGGIVADGSLTRQIVYTRGLADEILDLLITAGDVFIRGNRQG